MDSCFNLYWNRIYKMIPKYRAKRLDSSEWVEGHLIETFKADENYNRVFYHAIKLMRSDINYEIDPSTLMISFDNGLNWWKDFKMINDHLKRDLCSTMSRPKKECGCPDCGSSLIG